MNVHGNGWIRVPFTSDRHPTMSWSVGLSASIDAKTTTNIKNTLTQIINREYVQLSNLVHHERVDLLLEHLHACWRHNGADIGYGNGWEDVVDELVVALVTRSGHVLRCEAVVDVCNKQRHDVFINLILMQIHNIGQTRMTCTNHQDPRLAGCWFEALEVSKKAFKKVGFGTK